MVNIFETIKNQALDLFNQTVAWCKSNLLSAILIAVIFVILLIIVFAVSTHKVKFYKRPKRMSRKEKIKFDRISADAWAKCRADSAERERLRKLEEKAKAEREQRFLEMLKRDTEGEERVRRYKESQKKDLYDSAGNYNPALTKEQYKALNAKK